MDSQAGGVAPPLPRRTEAAPERLPRRRESPRCGNADDKQKNNRITQSTSRRKPPRRLPRVRVLFRAKGVLNHFLMPMITQSFHMPMIPMGSLYQFSL